MSVSSPTAPGLTAAPVAGRTCRLFGRGRRGRQEGKPRRERQARPRRRQESRKKPSGEGYPRRASPGGTSGVKSPFGRHTEGGTRRKENLVKMKSEADQRGPSAETAKGEPSRGPQAPMVKTSGRTSLPSTVRYGRPERG